LQLFTATFCRIEIDHCNGIGRTALHIAAGYGQMKSVQLLVEAGANVFALDNRGQTPAFVAADNGKLDCSRRLETVAVRMHMHNPELVDRLKIKAYKDLQKRVKKVEKTKKTLKKRNISTVEFPTTEKNTNTRPRHFSESHILRNSKKPQPKQVTEMNNFVLRPASSAEQLAEKKTGTLDTNSLKEDSQSVGGDEQTLQAAFRPLKTNTSGMLESLKSLPDIPAAPKKKKSSATSIADAEQLSDDDPKTRRISSISDAPGNMGRSVSVTSRMSTATYSGYPQPVFTENDSPLSTFLHALNITEISQKLFDEKMDLNTLLLCDENDFSSISLPLGPRKKLLAAIKARRETMTNPGKMQDTPL